MISGNLHVSVSELAKKMRYIIVMVKDEKEVSDLLFLKVFRLLQMRCGRGDEERNLELCSTWR